MCEQSVPNCNRTFFYASLSPGESLEIEIVAVGQRFGVVPATVITEVVDTQIKSIEESQHVYSYCTKLHYSLHFESLDAVPTLKLKVINKHQLPSDSYSDHPNDPLFEDFTVVIVASPCPKGYAFNSSAGICQCDRTILSHGLECDIQTGTVERTKQTWINATTEHLTNNTDSESGVIVHDHCPFDYCKPHSSYISLDNPDQQCHNNRSGILCGKCGGNLSTCSWDINVQTLL